MPALAKRSLSGHRLRRWRPLFHASLSGRFLCGEAVAGRFIRHEKGATAVEFALILLPFLTLLFMTMETGLVFLAQQSLETAVADAGRLVMTGQAKSLTADTFKSKVCSKGYALFNCNNIYVDVKNYGSSFSSINNTVQYDSSGNPKTQFSPGNAGEVAVVRLMYHWPINMPLTQPYLADSGSNKRLLVATAAFRNEP
ncbi:MAG: TadE/TadG family type IV pilus assembly protein [Xanthobacteraceae bacterium]